ncbi:uracil-DNA glycosylase [Aureimonas sp. SA4125]|uniref:uracil-DNA glycosylase n=1 Tax=Aureimonas sp. SA4125 TaxID=2826993 RepID=UPI001CC35327|nr:uracil-DNA glycosylase [Aureimonas sp. SA4125]BDA83742.1 uracil-DNA glycosylase [Aureimonas sp. SA4125]
MIPHPPPVTTREAAAALLEWYGDAGIDTIVLDAPRDRFAETAAEIESRAARRAPEASAPPRDGAGAAERSLSPPAASRREAHAAPPPTVDGFPALSLAVPDEIAVADAHQRAASAKTLDELREALAGFTGCNLRLTATQLVFGDGNPDADVMFVGEAPGREEDIAGEPFVGKSGQLLDRMLASIGMTRESVRVTNSVPWRPPGNRPPTPIETEMCLPFIARQIELVRPKILVCLGSPAAKVILKTEEGILRLRGTWHDYTFGVGPGDTIPTLPMLHPAYLLRQPAQKKLAWRDLLALKARLDERA